MGEIGPCGPCVCLSRRDPQRPPEHSVDAGYLRRAFFAFWYFCLSFFNDHYPKDHLKLQKKSLRRTNPGLGASTQEPPSVLIGLVIMLVVLGPSLAQRK